jgi:hypothetical protein
MILERAHRAHGGSPVVAGEGFPSYEGYLARLPAGLDSYPEVLAKGSLVRSVLLDHSPAILRGLPPPLLAWVTEAPFHNDWVSETRLSALIHAIAELRGWREAPLLEWTRRRNLELFSGPLYRVLMTVSSPEAMLRHAALRWANFHRGTTLTFEGISDDGARAALAFPKGIFDRLLLRSIGAAFGAALELAHVKQTAVVLEECADGFARYRARW